VQPEILARLTALYLRRQIFFHTVRFLVWICSKRLLAYSMVKIKELEQCIKDRMEQLHEIDKLLFEFVTLPFCPQPRERSKPLVVEFAQLGVKRGVVAREESLKWDGCEDEGLKATIESGVAPVEDAVCVRAQKKKKGKKGGKGNSGGKSVKKAKKGKKEKKADVLKSTDTIESAAVASPRQAQVKEGPEVVVEQFDEMVNLVT
jgi:hypothetical protein